MPRNFLWLVIGVNVLCTMKAPLKGNLDSPGGGNAVWKVHTQESLNRLSGGNNGEGWPL